MPSAYASAVVDMPADALWARVRDFASVKEWHPGIAACQLQGGAGDQPGTLRHLTLQDGAKMIERLVTLDDRTRSYSYAILEAPLPVTNYVSTLRISPVTDGDRAFIEWFSTFDCEPSMAGDMVATFAGGVYKGGLDALRDSA